MVKRYSDEFKEIVVKDIIENHLPLKAAFRKYSVERETIRRWLRKARPDLYKKHGDKIEVIPSTIRINEMSIEELRLENEKLRFENEALKKLGTLIPRRGNKK